MSFLDPILNPLLKLPILWAVVIISFIIALIIIVIYKFTTNQNLMKQLKEEMKEFQKQMKELRQHPEKMMEVQKKSMKTNMKYMSHSMRSTLFTFIPIILIFGWMTAHLAYEPILPGQEFTTTAVFGKGTSGEIELIVPQGIRIEGDVIKEITDSNVVWVLKGDAGEYLIEYKFDGKSYTQEVLITEEQNYKNPIKKIKNSQLKNLEIGNKKMKPMHGTPLQYIPWIGNFGWLGTYIILSIIFSIALRKLFKVY